MEHDDSQEQLFDYMAAGLAVVSSDAAPAARIIGETGAGLLFRSGDPRDLAEKLRQLLNQEAWDRYRRSGQKAVLSQYNWESDARVLLDAASRWLRNVMRRSCSSDAPIVIGVPASGETLRDSRRLDFVRNSRMMAKDMIAL